MKLYTTTPFIMIAIGGSFGAVSRFYLNIFIETDILNYFHFLNFGELSISFKIPAIFASFPVGILVVNMLGSLILGGFLTYMQYAGSNNIPLRNFVAVGFLGSFTTFSTFIIDSIKCLLFFLMHSPPWQGIFPHLKDISPFFEEHFSLYGNEFLLSHSFLFALCNILLNLILCLVCVGVGYGFMRKRYEKTK